jgi:hypothetical protein
MGYIFGFALRPCAGIIFLLLLPVFCFAGIAAIQGITSFPCNFFPAV